jgi:hypothetical protein
MRVQFRARPNASRQAAKVVGDVAPASAGASRLTIFEIHSIFYHWALHVQLYECQRRAETRCVDLRWGEFATRDARDPEVAIVRSSNAQNGF